MPADWETVHLFVSSTFDDMHAERDYLVKRVYPELQAWCDDRKLRLVEVDLRWGVTEEEAVDAKDTIRVCLESVDRCRPFFVGFIGQRYGWTPRRSDLSADTLARYPGLATAMAGEALSMTELEIRHALLTPFQADSDRPPLSTHALFFVRDEGFLADLPPSPPLLTRIYAGDTASNQAEILALDRLVGDILPATGRPVHRYEATWSAAHSTPELALPISSASQRQEVVARWRDRWREVAGVSVQGDHMPEGSPAADQARAFNARLTTGRLVDFTCPDLGGRSASLRDVVARGIKEALLARYPDRAEVPVKQDLQRELDEHERFRFLQVGRFVERPGVFDALDEYVRDDACDRLLAVTGPAGSGKSALLAKWTERISMDGTSRVLAVRFVGASDSSLTMDGLVRGLLRELLGRVANEPDGLPQDPAKLRKELPGLLRSVAEGGQAVVVIDGLDQLDTGLRDLAWLPVPLPSGIRLVASYREDAEGADQVTRRLSVLRCPTVRVEPFDEEDRRRLVVGFLRQYLKRLDDESLAALVSFPGSGNPLFLSVILSELRVFGSHAGLPRRIRASYGERPADAFEGVLARLQSDSLPTALDGAILVPLLFGGLAFTRRGLSDTELVDFVADTYPQHIPAQLGRTSADARDVLDAVYVYLRQVRSYLTHHAGRFDYFYDTFRQAAAAVVTRDGDERSARHPAAWWHCALAKLFRRVATTDTEDGWREASARELNELAYHCARTGDVQATLDLYLDVAYLEAVCLSGQSSGAADALHPGIYDLIANLQDAVRHLGRERPSSDGLEVLVRLERAVSMEAHRLGRWNEREDPAGFARQLFNRAHLLDLPALAHTARKRLDRTDRPVLLLRALAGGGTSHRERTLIGHTDRAEALRMSDAGDRALSAANDGTLRLWDLQTGRTAALFDGHDGRVTAMAISDDWTRLVSGGIDCAVRLWDVTTGRLLHLFWGHGSSIETIALSRDGATAVSGGDDGEVWVWDLNHFESRRLEGGHSGLVTAVCIDRAAGVILSASHDRTLISWELDSGRKQATMMGHEGAIVTAALSDDATTALSGGFDEEVNFRVWDVATGAQRHAVRAHFARVDTVKFLHGNSYALTASLFSPNLRLWDLGDRPYPFRTFAAGGNVDAVSVTLGGKRVVSLAGGFVQRWDPVYPTARNWIETAGRVLAIDREGDRALTDGHDGALDLWNVAQAERRPRTEYRADSHRGPVRIAAMFPEGERVATASDDHTVRIWQVATGDALHVLSGHDGAVTAVAITPDGRHLVSASRDRTLKVWDTDGGGLLHTLRGHSVPERDQADRGGPRDRLHDAWQGGVNAVALTADGTRVVSASMDRTLIVWDLHSGGQLGVLRGHEGAVHDVAITPDGARVVSGAADGTLRVWDLVGCTELRVVPLDLDEVRGLALAPGGRAVVAQVGGDLMVWSFDEEHVPIRIEAAQLAATVLSRQRWLAVAHGPNLRVLDLATGRTLRELDASGPGTLRVQCLFRDGQLAVASWLGSSRVEVWDLTAGRAVAWAELGQALACAVVSPDGATLVTGGVGGDVAFLDIVGL